ncbi:MAG: hypothetical protein WCO35_01390 [Candidatus Nomurabacteria bacterium]
MKKLFYILLIVILVFSLKETSVYAQILPGVNTFSFTVVDFNNQVIGSGTGTGETQKYIFSINNHNYSSYVSGVTTYLQSGKSPWHDSLFTILASSKTINGITYYKDNLGNILGSSQIISDNIIYTPSNSITNITSCGSGYGDFSCISTSLNNLNNIYVYMLSSLTLLSSNNLNINPSSCNDGYTFFPTQKLFNGQIQYICFSLSSAQTISSTSSTNNIASTTQTSISIPTQLNSSSTVATQTQYKTIQSSILPILGNQKTIPNLESSSSIITKLNTMSTTSNITSFFHKILKFFKFW